MKESLRDAISGCNGDESCGCIMWSEETGRYTLHQGTGTDYAWGWVAWVS